MILYTCTHFQLVILITINSIYIVCTVYTTYVNEVECPRPWRALLRVITGPEYSLLSIHLPISEFTHTYIVLYSHCEIYIICVCSAFTLNTCRTQWEIDGICTPITLMMLAIVWLGKYININYNCTHRAIKIKTLHLNVYV